jgi:hypothetical protein
MCITKLHRFQHFIFLCIDMSNIHGNQYVYDKGDKGSVFLHRYCTVQYGHKVEEPYQYRRQNKLHTHYQWMRHREHHRVVASSHCSHLLVPLAPMVPMMLPGETLSHQKQRQNLHQQ